mgnify:CR=1 FL=1
MHKLIECFYRKEYCFKILKKEIKSKQNYILALLLVVQAAGFSVTEWRILATLASKPGLSIGGLAEITVSKQPTVTRLLDRMEAKALVERYPHDTDRRVTMVRITPKGRTIVAHLMEQAKEHEHRVLQPFGLKRAESLKVTLRRIIELHRGSA